MSRGKTPETGGVTAGFRPEKPHLPDAFKSVFQEGFPGTDPVPSKTSLK
jgi:hypothetical protein